MSSRYNNRKKLTNTKRFYQEYMAERGIKKIRQYATPKMRYPKPAAIASEIQRISHIWKSRDMYWKLAAEHYGDSHLWWVIAWFNKKPTESHVKLGDIIQIPMPLETVLFHLHNG
jgi:nucleoid-associated protein YgaU